MPSFSFSVSLCLSRCGSAAWAGGPGRFTCGTFLSKLLLELSSSSLAASWLLEAPQLRTSAQRLLCCEGRGQLCRPRIGLRAASCELALRCFHRQGGRAAPRPRAPSASTPNSASRPRDTRPRRKPPAPLAFFASFTGLRLLGLGLRAVPHALQVGLQSPTPTLGNRSAGSLVGLPQLGLIFRKLLVLLLRLRPRRQKPRSKDREKDASLELPAFARAACKADRSACIGLRHLKLSGLAV